MEGKDCTTAFTGYLGHLKFMVCFALGVALGYYLRVPCPNSPLPTTKLPIFPKSNIEPTYSTTSDSQSRSSKGFMELEELSSKPFSCNTRSAYEELTRLHSRREQLEQREKRGESNRARTATIIRKAQEARAAEGAFQACLRNTIPELLMVWNEDLKTNSVRLKEASFNKLHDKDGVNLDVLQETADMLDLVEN